MTRAPEDHPELLSVGLTTLDVVHRAAAPPPVNTKITAERQDVAAGGPAANAAVVAQSLGVPATLVTAVGHSPVAAAARADLRARGVRVLDTAPEHDLAVSAIVVSQESGQRTVTSLDSGGSDPVWPDQAGLGSPAVVLIDGHYPHLALAAAEYAREHGALVVLDAGRWREVFAELFPLADIAAASADFTLPGGDRGPAALVRAGARMGVVTHGAAAVQFATAREHGQVPVPAVPVRDTLGAGDTFHGALAASLALRGRVDGASVAAVQDAVRVAAHRVGWIGPRSFLADLPPVGR